MINISKEFKNRLYKTDIYRVLCNIRGTRRTDLPSDFMKNKPQPQSLDNMSPKTLRSDAGLLLIWLNSSHRVPDCIIVIQIAPFAWFLFFFHHHLEQSSSWRFSWHPLKNPPRVGLTRRPRFGPPSPGLSYPKFPPLISSGWPGGCRTLVPSSRRSSATWETTESILTVCPITARLTCQTKGEVGIIICTTLEVPTMSHPITFTFQMLRGRNETNTDRVV